MLNERWLLPTNTNNLSMMISQGLICEPDGCSKYYTDILNNHPGYIPIIRRDNICQVQKALQLATSESEHLVPCIIEVDLNKIIAGTVFCENGSEINLSKTITGEENIHTLYLPSPIPLYCISKILFDSLETKQKYVNDANTLYGNVSLTSFKLCQPKSAKIYFTDKSKQTNESVFGFDEEKSSLPDETNVFRLPERPKLDYNKVYSLGGILGALFFLTKNGKQSEKYFKQFSDLDVIDNESFDDYDLKLITNYFFDTNSESIVEHSSLSQMIFPILDVIVNKSDIKSSIIEVLKSNKLQGQSSERANEIADMLLDYLRNKINKPASEIFMQSSIKSKRSKIEMLLLMLFYRDNTEALFRYHLDIFSEIDYILFAMLFGLRDKYSGLPLYLKKLKSKKPNEGLKFFISILMAKYAHKLIISDLKFSTIKPPPTINHMLNANKIKPESIKQISKQLSIQDCFKTVFPSKEFTHSNGKNTCLGVILARYETIEDKYFNAISKTIIDSEVYNKILAKYYNVRPAELR